jgi:3-oxoacyl-[acyl-carrier protein] reductase
MDLGIANKVVLVAASSTGIGRAIAEGYARERAKVIMCARNEGPLTEAADKIRQAIPGAEIATLTVDLSSAESIENLIFEGQKAIGGPIDILVNNAGGPPPGPFDAHSLDVWRRAIETSFLSAVDLARRVLPGMRARKSGRVISLTSYGALEYIPGLLLSSSIRPAVLAWTRATAREVAADGVGLVAVCQGLFLTDRVRSLVRTRAQKEGGTPEEALARWVAEVPMGRMGHPSELGDLVAYLASPRAAYVTGAAIAIDGEILRRLA